jgi:hypothetical protein
MTDQTPQPKPRVPVSLAGSLVDLAFLGGAGLITYGVGLIHRPAAFIVAGGFLLLGAWLLARKGV